MFFKYYPKSTICILLLTCLYFVLFTTVFNSFRKGYIIRSYVDVETRTVFQKVKSITNCSDNLAHFEYWKRDKYSVLYNYVVSSKRFRCEESVTYVTHADYTFLDNLINVLDRWQGPISIALYAPGSDFNITLESILYLRNCLPLMKKYVSFHLYYLEEHAPVEVPSHEYIMDMTYNCPLDAPFKNANRTDSYRVKNKLTYPINLGRNIARSMAETHYVFTCDIELYPSPNLIPRFLEMITKSEELLHTYYPVVFPLHVFEIEPDLEVPSNKTELQELFKKHKVVLFHRFVCPLCHAIPKTKEWMRSKQNRYLKVFHMTKRTNKLWEPFYIGTKADPPFDERLTWERRRDKKVQAYTMCVLDYWFLILDDAFLVHRPGIKRRKDGKGENGGYSATTNHLIGKVILPEITKIYGKRSECKL